MNIGRTAIINGIVALTTVVLMAPVAVVHSLLVAKPTSRSETQDGDRIPEQKSEEQMNQRVKEFFVQYERANSCSDVPSIGDLYADTFMFGGPNGLQVVKKEDFLKVVPKMKTHLSSMGVLETQLQSVEATSLNSKYLLAKVAWRMKIRESLASKRVDAFATYVLIRGQGDVLSIVFQIDHQDLATIIKDQQNTK